jgi:hypothetical protein
LRIGWKATLAIGVVLLVSGAVTVLAAQSEINYVHSCEKPVSCGTTHNPTTKVFLSSSLLGTLQQAQTGWILGALVFGAGLIMVVYGVYLHPERRGESPVQKAISGT